MIFVFFKRWYEMMGLAAVIIMTFIIPDSVVLMMRYNEEVAHTATDDGIGDGRCQMGDGHGDGGEIP